jgi:aldose 1-epimerase
VDEPGAVALEGGGIRATILPFGATLARLEAPDRTGRLADVVLGFDRSADYAASPAHVGGVVGRYANRIAGARFQLDGAEHALTANEGRHHLHGGARGFDRREWRVEGREPAGVALALESPDGEEGYPGTLRCRAVYRISGPGELALDFEATCDRATPLSLTQHAYWNLAGPPGEPVLEHELEIAADLYAPVDAEHLPRGALHPVVGTPFDFRAPRTLAHGLREGGAELALHGGYDHPFALRGHEGDLRFAARLREPRSGRVLEIHTSAPCLQLYGGQQLAEGPGQTGWRHGPGRGLCLEAQRFPDAPNQPVFPAAILRAGEVHRQTTRYRLLVSPRGAE